LTASFEKKEKKRGGKKKKKKGTRFLCLLKEAPVFSPLSPLSLPLAPLFLTRQREGFWLLASPKASKCFALVSGSPGIFFSAFSLENKEFFTKEGGERANA